jgi:hypothetical protein
MKELSCLLDTPRLRAFYDEANGWLYNQWLDVSDEQSFREDATALSIRLPTLACTKVLSDHSSLVGNWQGAVPWATRAHFDCLAAQGITYFAWVCNKSYHNRTTMEQALYDLERPIADIFRDVDSAYEWLRRCPTVSVEAACSHMSRVGQDTSCP